MAYRAAIAVMPFANLSDDGSNEHFAIGIGDDIVTNLQSWGSFPVLGRGVTEPYRGTTPNLDEISASLGVRYLLTGSVRTAGDDIRVTAQLIDSDSREVVRALGPFDRNLADIFAIQDEISSGIVNAIAPEIARREMNTASIDQPNDLASWELVMRAQGLTAKGNYDDVRKAESLLRLAIEREPGYAAAYARLAEIGHDLSSTNYARYIGDDAASAALDEALRNARIAVDLNPSLVDARIWLGHLLLHHRRIDEAVVELQQAVRLSPAHGQAHAELGFGYAISGDLDAAFAEFQKSSDLSPNDPQSIRIKTFEALAYLYAGRNSEAAAAARHVLNLTGDSARNVIPYLVEISALMRLGDLDTARIRYDEFQASLGPIDWSAIERAAWTNEQLSQVKRDLAILETEG